MSAPPVSPSLLFLPDDDALVALLRLLLRLEDADLAPIAARSYLHVNQFVKIPLHRDAESVLRLHLWRAPAAAAVHEEAADEVIEVVGATTHGGVEQQQQQQQPQNPHSHGWAFRSRVLRGSFTHTLFADVGGGGETTEVWNSSDGGGTATGAAGDAGDAKRYNAYELDLAHPDGTTKMRERARAPSALLAPRFTARMDAGETYAVSRSDVHTLVPCAPGGITLVRTETAHDDAAVVYSLSRLEPQAQQEKRTTLTVPELRARLRQTLERLQYMAPPVAGATIHGMHRRRHVLDERKVL